MMSANSTAASTPWRRTGWSVTSAQSSGVPAISKNECRSRRARYSGQRPAGLAHEPHRRALDRLAPQRADEERLGHRRRLAPACRRFPRMPSRQARSASAGTRTSSSRSQAGAVGARARRARERRRRPPGTGWRLLPLARRARQPDRLGRPPDGDLRRSLQASGPRPTPGPRADAAGPLPARASTSCSRTATGSPRSATSCSTPTSMSAYATPARRSRISRRRSSRRPAGTSSSGRRTRRATPRSAARSRAASAHSAPTARAEAATRRSRSRSSARRSCRRSSRTAKSRAPGLEARGRGALDPRRPDHARLRR